MVILLALLITINLANHTPQRLMAEHQRYEIDSSALQLFMTPDIQELVPAIILVHTENWREYAVLLDLADPYLETPFIFAWSLGEDDLDLKLSTAFPNRAVYHYYPEKPGKIYESAQK